MKETDLDEGKVQMKTRYGALSGTEEEEYEAASVFAKRGW